jgi:thiol-disulfide isomerase/thioredoxin
VNRKLLTQSLLLILLLYSCREVEKSCKILVENNLNLMPDQVILNNEAGSYEPESKNGYFIFSPALKKPEYFVLTVGSKSFNLYLAPGDNISIPSEVSNISSRSHIPGKGALLSNYLMDDNLLSEEIQNNTDFDSIYSLNPPEFIRSIDSLYNVRASNLEIFIEKNRIYDKVFVSTERKRIFYSAAIERNQYYRDHMFLTNEIPVLNKEYDQYLDKADLNDSASLHLPEYKKFLNTYFERFGLQDYYLPQNQGKETHFTEYSYARSKGMVYNKKIRNYILYKIIDYYVNDTPIDHSRSLVSVFNKDCTDDHYLGSINNLCRKLDRLKKGMAAPGFTFPDIAGRKVSLSDFGGKLVLIDVWNSNCSPCFKEFPLMEQLINKYRGKEIVFIGISFDPDEILWKKTMKVKNLKGVQLFANGWDSQFGRDYMVWSNPRFILIDRNANFISARAPKSSENLDSLIEQNL